jgi:hypothetical protein
LRTLKMKIILTKVGDNSNIFCNMLRYKARNLYPDPVHNEYGSATQIIYSDCVRSALPTLLKMATSFAKLALRREVIEEDALIACYLYEEFITSIFGNSLIGKFYLRHFFKRGE